jgi:UV DNA damage endonuclease
MNRPLRLGFPVKVMGRPDLPSNDTRGWRKGPHLKRSLELLDAVLDYLVAAEVDMYRMSSDLAPYATHPDMPQFHAMVAESDAELAAFGAKARSLDIRLSFHPSQFVLLNSPDAALTRKSVWDLASQAEMLDRMGMGPEAVLVTHVGGVYGDREESRARWIEGYTSAPSPSAAASCSRTTTSASRAADVLWIHDRCSVPLVFDYQHYWCLNPEGLSPARPSNGSSIRGAGSGPSSTSRPAHRDARAQERTRHGSRVAYAGKELKGSAPRRRALTPTSVKTVLVPPI